MSRATIEEIAKIEPHPNADRLQLAWIRGFQCIVPIDKYSEGQKVVYIHPDTVLPNDQEWSKELLKYARKRTRAAKIRGFWSEGIIIDILDPSSRTIGDEVGDLLGLKHYEAPLPKEGNPGVARPSLPYDIPKTDETRWENLVNSNGFSEKLQDQLVDVTLKVDGQSWSAYYNLEEDKFGILGRKLEYDVEAKNLYTAHIERYNIQQKLTEYCKKHQISLCLRGESYGGKIQNHKANPHKGDHGLVIFSTYLIRERCYAGRENLHYFRNVCNELGLPMVKILEENVALNLDLVRKYSSELQKIEGNYFEGVVIKGNNFSLKVINKKYDSIK